LNTKLKILVQQIFVFFFFEGYYGRMKTWLIALVGVLIFGALPSLVEHAVHGISFLVRLIDQIGGALLS